MTKKISPMDSRCKIVGCVVDCTHPVARMCPVHYLEYRNLSKKKAAEKMLSDPIKRDQILSYYRNKYYLEYKEKRKVIKYCACGQVAQKQSRLSLCLKCAKLHREKRKIQYQLNRKRTHLPTKIRENIKNRLRRALKTLSFNSTKNASIVKILGCTIKELKVHLESRFYPNPETGEMMNWDNYGFYGWHIDHKVPLSSVSSKEKLYELNYYLNLQPLWAKDNFKKGDSYE